MNTSTIDLHRALTGSPEHPVIDVERRFALPPAEVWDAVVQPERLARWLGSIEGGERPELGAAFTIRFDDEPEGHADCRLLACDPGRSLTVQWCWTGEPDSVVHLAVRQSEEGSVLRLRHELVAPQSIVEYGAGWEAHLDGMGDALAGLEPRPFAMIEEGTWTRMSDGVLQVERVVDAPRDLVWAAFTTVEGLRSWWWRHWTDTTVAADVRVGGGLRIAAPGAGIVLEGEVLALDADGGHFAATWVWTDADGTSADEAFDVRLTAAGDATRVTVRHSGPWADAAPAESYRQGWEFVLAELAAVVGR